MKESWRKRLERRDIKGVGRSCQGGHTAEHSLRHDQPPVSPDSTGRDLSPNISIVV